MKQWKPPQRSSRHDPDLILAYLQYALEDVRELSERSSRELELAIRALAEDTRAIRVNHPTASIRPS